MKVAIKYIHCPDVEDLELFKPEESENFSLFLQVMAGPEGVDGEESFDVTVCTPQWLMNNYGADEVIIGRHYLLVFKYNWGKIKNKIEEFARNCSGENWQECALKFSRLGYWEFEDYQE